MKMNVAISSTLPLKILAKQTILASISNETNLLFLRLFTNVMKNVQLLAGNLSRLVLPGPDPTTIEVSDGKERLRHDLRTTHEEADVVIFQQMVHIVSIDALNIGVIFYDT